MPAINAEQRGFGLPLETNIHRAAFPARESLSELHTKSKRNRDDEHKETI